MKRLGFVLAAVFFLFSGVCAVNGSQEDLSLTKANFPEVNGGIIVAQAKDVSTKQEYEKYQKKIQNELKEYKKKMKQLQAKAKKLEDKAKAEAKEEMGDLQRKIKVAEHKLQSMKSVSGEAWEKMKSEVDSTMEDVKESYNKIAARF
jgi:peptidoglycan hydrolase CwlO-like protein